jgi:hypothetical protein
LQHNLTWFSSLLPKQSCINGGNTAICVSSLLLLFSFHGMIDTHLVQEDMNGEYKVEEGQIAASSLASFKTHCRQYYQCRYESTYQVQEDVRGKGTKANLKQSQCHLI